MDKYFLNTFNEKLDRFSLRYCPNVQAGRFYPAVSDARAPETFFLSIFSSILVDSLVSLYSLGLLSSSILAIGLLICGVWYFTHFGLK